MFTGEEKIRAIELYFKYGKKLAPVVRELGYPSKRNLRRWIRSWEAGGGVHPAACYCQHVNANVCIH